MRNRLLLLPIITLLISSCSSGADKTANNTSTIDSTIQSLCDDVLEYRMKEFRADEGQVIVMDVKTGEIRAISHFVLEQDTLFDLVPADYIADDGVPAMIAPASVLACLETGKIDTTTLINTQNGICNIKGKEVKDHNWRIGGFETLNIPGIIYNHSNIGLCKMIDTCFHDNPKAYLSALAKVGFGKPVATQLVSSQPQYSLSEPNNPLAWVGKDQQVSTLQLLTFYNAIANDGIMVSPTLTKGNVKTIKNKIADIKHVKELKTILRKHVTEGKRNLAQSRKIAIAGYRADDFDVEDMDEGTTYQGQFCGFFPYEHPRYTIIVSWKMQGKLYGRSCSVIAHHIAEGMNLQ